MPTSAVFLFAETGTGRVIGGVRRARPARHTPHTAPTRPATRVFAPAPVGVNTTVAARPAETYLSRNPVSQGFIHWTAVFTAEKSTGPYGGPLFLRDTSKSEGDNYETSENNIGSRDLNRTPRNS